MVDLWGDGVAVAALVVAGIVAWFTWGQLRAQRAQLDAAVEQIKVDEGKLARLSDLVVSLKGMLETQKAQVAALEKQVEIATRALKLQEETLAFESAKAATDAQLKQGELDLQRAQLAWDQTGPLAKAKVWVDRGLEDAGRKIRRFLGR